MEHEDNKRDDGASWTELPAPVYPPKPTDARQPNGEPDPNSWTLDTIWTLETGGPDQPVRLANIPDIEDVRLMVEIARSLGVNAEEHIAAGPESHVRLAQRVEAIEKIAHGGPSPSARRRRVSASA